MTLQFVIVNYEIYEGAITPSKPLHLLKFQIIKYNSCHFSPTRPILGRIGVKDNECP